jgi:uracil phosphoribosyltransferase
MANKIILKAEDLDGYLTETDKAQLSRMNALYQRVLDCFAGIGASITDAQTNTLTSLYNEMGSLMQDICKDEKNISVYSFVTAQESHAEVSRLIAKLRDVQTGHEEFIYYIQRAYELLFNLAYSGGIGNGLAAHKNYLVIKTPVTFPAQNYAVHKITDIDREVKDTVMCVMLRGALLPSMIMSKEIQEYSSNQYVTPFALFKISRDDTKKENNMEYILDLDRSYFDFDALNNKDLVFADPMNATGGSLVTVVKYLLSQGVKPRSVRFFNAIAALKGALRVVRALDNCQVYTLWMDPALNESAYIMPGLGDAGDRINGKDSGQSRNIIQLIADYGSNIAQLYRSQLREIESMVLNKRGK